jgi:hypothetical protein
MDVHGANPALQAPVDASGQYVNVDGQQSADLGEGTANVEGDLEGKSTIISFDVFLLHAPYTAFASGSSSRYS